MTKTERTKGTWERCRDFIEEQSCGEWDDKTLNENTRKLVYFIAEDRATRHDALIAENKKLRDALDYIQMHSNEKAIREKAASALSQTGVDHDCK